MNQSNTEMSSFLTELAGEATQKLEAQRAQQMDQQAKNQSVNAALDRAFQFFNLFAKHLNALEPEVPRIYAFDGKTQFSRLKWKKGVADFRKQSLADNALLDHVFFQVRLDAPEPVMLTRRWEQYEDARKDIEAFGLKPMADMHDLWRNRSQRANFQVNLEPVIMVRMLFHGNYADGSVNLECNNLDGFGEVKTRLKPELLQPAIFDGIGRFLMGRSNSLPQELGLAHCFSRNF
ncbi:MAG: hypothetical protein PHQ60_09950 [Sideroxydans sp.]|nr:hypothetical protein [Sideroxydans sp.]